MRAKLRLGLVVALLASACEGATTQTSPTDTVPVEVTESPDGETGAGSPSASPEPVTEPTARGYHRMIDVGGTQGILMLGGFNGPGCCPVEDAAWAYGRRGTWTAPQFPPLPDLNDAAFDTESGLLVLSTPGETPLTPDATGSPTFTLDPRTGVVEQMGPGGPDGLLGVNLAYDSESDRVIAFGGWLDVYADDTWAYDVNSDTWTQMQPEVAPPGRNFSAMAYDPVTDQVVLFSAGGYRDTWAYDYDSDTWTNLNPRPSPSARDYASMVYDPVREQMILFGGTTYPSERPLGDTWAYDPKTNRWTELAAAEAPSLRGWHAMAYDPRRDVIVLFGGGPDRSQYTAETWTFDPSTNTWSRVT
jgi:hypothetical protein